MEGHRLFADRDAGGFRDFLEGTPVRAGTSIQMLIDGRWVGGRYEANFSTRQAHFHTRRCDPAGQEETVIAIDRSTMRFRFPPKYEENDLESRLSGAIYEAQQSRQALRDILAAAQQATSDQVYEDETSEEAAERRYWALKQIIDEARYGLGY